MTIWAALTRRLPRSTLKPCRAEGISLSRLIPGFGESRRIAGYSSGPERHAVQSSCRERVVAVKSWSMVSGSTGLVMCRSKPASLAWWRSSSRPQPVSATREIPAPQGSRRNCRATSYPFKSGMPMSMSATSGRKVCASDKAARPPRATRTSCPASSSNIASESAASLLSSATITRRVAVAAGGPPSSVGFSDGASLSGKRTVNSLPWPGPSLRASIVPPCRSNRPFTSARPIPRPPSERVAALSISEHLENSSQRFRRKADAIIFHRQAERAVQDAA